MARFRWVWVIVGSLALCVVFFLSSCGADGAPCKEDAECPWGYFCRTGNVCHAGCRHSVECPKGELCVSHQCVPALKDEDLDGFHAPLDCNDSDPLINPAVVEICGNKKDDNCDGVVDEEGCVQVDCRPSQVRECYDGKEKTLTFPGTQCQKGRQICNSKGSWGDCQGQILPGVEQCDGVDNDCDGAVDEGDDGGSLKQSCFEGEQKNRGKGSCVEGSQVCQGAKWLECKGEGAPTVERCNGKDDDCNGIVDDVAGLEVDCLTGQPGRCLNGKTGCDIKSEKVVCVPLQAPQKEICDGKDDDCDGAIDNGCPYVATKVAELKGFGHALALSGQTLAVSLRDDKEIVIYDVSGSLKRSHEISLPDAPYGLLFAQKTLYTVTQKALFAIDVEKGSVGLVVTFPQSSHEANLALLGGKILSRYAGTDSTGQALFGMCRTDPSTKQTSCASLQGTISRLGLGIVSNGIFGLLVSNLGIHHVDTLSMQEDTSRLLKLPSTDADDIASDLITLKTVVTDRKLRQVYLLNLSFGQTRQPIQLKDANGALREPGRVVAAGGFAFVGLRDGKGVAVIDLKKQEFVRTVGVGLAPLGITVSEPDASKNRQIWVACPGDDSLWRFSIGP